MSLQAKLAHATGREQYIAILKMTLHELSEALFRLAEDEGLPQPFRIRFRDRGLLYSRIAELWIHGAEVWIKEPQGVHLSLPILGTLTSADGRTITLGTLE